MTPHNMLSIYCGLFKGIIPEFAWRDWGKP